MSSSKIIVWGTPSFAVPIIRSLASQQLVGAVVTQPDKPHGRSRSVLVPSPVKVVAQELALPVLSPATLRDSNVVALFRDFLPATFLIVAYGKIIPASLLALSEMPAINIHPSLLPDLRGPSPIQTALLKGYTHTGLTLMQLDEEVDHGPILAQKKVIINPSDTYETLSEKLSLHAVQFLDKYLMRYLQGKLHAVPQDHRRATFCSMIDAESGKLTYEDTVEHVINKIRALNPWPGTWISWNGKRLKILSAQPSLGVDAAPQKQLSRSASGALRIRFSDGSIDVATIQLEGKKPMNSIDFLRGNASILNE